MSNTHLGKYFPIDETLLSLADHAEARCQDMFRSIEETSEKNQCRVIRAFQEWKVSETHFVPTIGYGYGDRGREVLDGLYASLFGCEDALVRMSIASGTAALSIALFACTRPGQKVLYVTGNPYDTIMAVAGIGMNITGSLAEYGVGHRVIPLKKDATPDMAAIREALGPDIGMVFIQRSRGYRWDHRVESGHIRSISRMVKEVCAEAVILVDNCYGEFVATEEPTSWGADLVAGSLIKNPGGGLCPAGGYIAGRKDLIQRCAARLYAPGLGKEVGSSVTDKRLLFQGLFMAPHTVAQSLKGSVFAASLMDLLSYPTAPGYLEHRQDIVQLIQFKTEEELLSFCRGIQEASPVDAHVVPYPWIIPGYDQPVVMAAGTFVSGSSIEFSADAPIRIPPVAYLQGGLIYGQVKLSILLALGKMQIANMK